MIRLGNFNVVLDTCVLYDSQLRDLLLNIADRELYQPIWSDMICEELKKNIIKNANVPEQKAIKLLRAMNEAFPEALTDSKSNIIELTNTDINEKDRHVVRLFAVMLK